MKIERFESVWDALEDDPMERERLKMRSRSIKFSLGDLFDLATRAGLRAKLSIDETETKKASKRAA